jgi:hypothetical protein
LRNRIVSPERVDGHIQKSGGDRVIDNGVVWLTVELSKFFANIDAA